MARIGDNRLPAHFWDKVHEDTETGCWTWTGTKTPSGYGIKKLHIDGRRTDTRTHRLAYMRIIGPIPDPLVLDHLCRNRACCNPDHLEAVTRGENNRRGIGGWNFALRRFQTHCLHGHEFTPENTYKDKRGRRTCKQCARAAQERYRDRMREVACG